MSRIRADRVTNKEGTGAPLFPNGIRVVGLTSLSNVVAGVTTFTSDVSIGGTLTYEDVTNIDSVGLITARSGLKVTAGGVDVTAGGIDVAGGGSNIVGVVTASTGIDAASNLILKTGGSERARIDQYGRVMIGTDTAGEGSADDLNIATTGQTGITIRSGTSSGGQIYFADGTSGDDRQRGIISYQHGGNYMRFYTNASERLRITEDGAFGIAGANYGTSGQVLTSQGNSASPQWADAGGGAWELLQSASNPNTSTVNFVGLTTTYAAYKVQFMGANINSSNSREMRCRIYLNDALQTGNNYRHMSMDMQAGSNSVSGYGGTYNAIILSGQGQNSRGYNGELTFPMKLRTSGSTESLQAFYGTCISEYYGNTIRGYHEGSYSNLLTGIQFDSPDNYNVTDGQFYLYGLTRT